VVVFRLSPPFCKGNFSLCLFLGSAVLLLSHLFWLPPFQPANHSLVLSVSSHLSRALMLFFPLTFPFPFVVSHSRDSSLPFLLSHEAKTSSPLFLRPATPMHLSASYESCSTDRFSLIRSVCILPVSSVFFAWLISSTAAFLPTHRAIHAHFFFGLFSSPTPPLNLQVSDPNIMICCVFIFRSRFLPPSLTSRINSAFGFPNHDSRCRKLPCLNSRSTLVLLRFADTMRIIFSSLCVRTLLHSSLFSHSLHALPLKTSTRAYLSEFSFFWRKQPNPFRIPWLKSTLVLLPHFPQDISFFESFHLKRLLGLIFSLFLSSSASFLFSPFYCLSRVICFSSFLRLTQPRVVSTWGSSPLRYPQATRHLFSV